MKFMGSSIEKLAYYQDKVMIIRVNYKIKEQQVIESRNENSLFHTYS